MPTDHQTPPDGDAVAVPRELLEALVQRNDALTARVEQLERRLDERPAASPGGPAPTPLPTPGSVEGPGVGGPVGRRRLLGAGLAAAGAAAAGTAAALATGSPAAAGNGDNLKIGSDVNTGSAATGLSVQGTTALYGIGVTDNGALSLPEDPAVWGHAKNQAFSTGVFGQGDQSATGVLGLTVTNGVDPASAVIGEALGLGGTGVEAIGPTQLWLRPYSSQSPPTSTVLGRVGSLRWTTSTDAALWACIADGTPGTWRKIVGTGTAGAFHLLPTPVRVYDSRAGSTPAQGPKTPLAPGVARTIDLKHNSSGVPAGATGVLLTILLVNAATANGNMTVWANDKPKPQSNTMVWGGSTGRFTGTAVTAVDAQARVKIDASHSTHIVLDVVGYYR